jgi:hypothetical protein
MRIHNIHVLFLVVGVMAFMGCGSDSTDSGNQAGTGGTGGGAAGEGGTAGTAGGAAGVGGTAGTAGGAAGVGGTAGTAGGAAGVGGTAGTAGGAAGVGGTAGAAGADNFWDGDYSTCSGQQSHNAGDACMTSCHTSGSHKLAFGGTVYSGTSGKSGVQVGVKVGSDLIQVCSGSNGNFYYLANSTIDWANAEVRVRNANGELLGHPSNNAATGDCNSCHGSSNRIPAP